MKDKFYEQLLERLSVPDGNILTPDDIAQWPEGKLVELIDQCRVKEISPSETVICNECPEGCPIVPYIRPHPGTNELVGVYICPHKDNIGRFEVDLNRRRRWEIVVPKKKTRKKRKKKTLTSKDQKAAASFTRWTNYGEACFVLDGDRIKFWNGDDLTDLRLRSGSRAHRLLEMLYQNHLTKGEVKKEIGTNNTAPSESVRDVNRAINDKIRKLNIQNIPNNVEFVGIDERTEQYGIQIPIYTKADFDHL